MASYSPVALVKEADQSLRRAQGLASKVQATVLRIAEKNQDPALERGFGVLLDQLRRLDAELDPSLMTQYRQAERLENPRVRPGQPEPPVDLTCRKCGETKEPADFFFDDGHGHYAYTTRCFKCRRAGRKGQPGARAERKAYARNNAASPRQPELTNEGEDR